MENAPPTERAPAFADFDITRLDHLSGALDTLKSLIWVAIDLVSQGSAHGENLLHAALNQYERADAQLQAIHSDILASKAGGLNA